MISPTKYHPAGCDFLQPEAMFVHFSAIVARIDQATDARKVIAGAFAIAHSQATPATPSLVGSTRAHFSSGSRHSNRKLLSLP